MTERYSSSWFIQGVCPAPWHEFYTVVVAVRRCTRQRSSPCRLPPSPVLRGSLPASAAKFGSPMFGIGGVYVDMLTPFASSFYLRFSPLEQIT
jgi:hypothetical protein